MERWEHFSKSYDNWADVQNDLADLEKEGWEAVSLATLTLPTTSHRVAGFRFFLIMKRRVGKEANGD